ncbi:ATP-binding protein [Planctobacterium marinum]|uniref:histidine kinase n=1 Tax=Planctobacterium marinum TaxID=1631968 RepID=A0AA48I4K0_9ALTE|nr:hypothetical protein MACH26_13260 [Planctobacterium marinum]
MYVYKNTSPFQILIKALLLSALLLFNPFASAQLPESEPLQQARKLQQNSQYEDLISYLVDAIENGELRERERLIGIDMLVRAYLYRGDIQQAKERNNQLKLEALHTEDELYTGRALLNDGEIVQTQGKHLDAISFFKQALSQYKKAGNSKFVANALLEISSSFGHINQNIEALSFAEQSLALGEEIEDLTTIANAYNSIGMLHDNMGNLSQALEAHMKTIELDRQRGDIDELATSYFNVASIYKKMEDYKQARFFTLEALSLDLPGNNPDFLGHDYNMLAELDLAINDPESALKNAKQAEHFFNVTKADGHLGLVYNNLARIHLKLKDIEQARSYIERAQKINENVGQSKHLIQSLLIKAEILMAQAQYQDALTLLTSVKEETIAKQNFEQIKTLFTLQSQALELAGLTEEALRSYKDFYRLKDEYERQNHTSIMAQLQNQMDYLQKEHQIELLESKSAVKELQLERAKLEKKQWIAGLVLLVLLLAVIGYRERTKRKLAALEKRLLAKSVEQKNAMLAEVAHELRSPLTALKLQIESLQYNLEDDPKTAYLRLNNKIDELNKLIEDLYDLARADNGLLKLNFETLDFQDLFEEITDGYREVVEHKGLKLQTRIDVSAGELVSVDALRIKQVIANLLRNSIHYTSAPGTILCTARRIDNSIEIQLEDSAPGVSATDMQRLFERMYRADGTKEHDNQGSGLGLSICKSLIEAHNGSIVASESRLGGLKITIHLPALQQEFQKAA